MYYRQSIKDPDSGRYILFFSFVVNDLSRSQKVLSRPKESKLDTLAILSFLFFSFSSPFDM